MIRHSIRHNMRTGDQKEGRRKVKVCFSDHDVCFFLFHFTLKESVIKSLLIDNKLNQLQLPSSKQFYWPMMLPVSVLKKGTA